MGIPVLILGESGSGKTASLRNMAAEKALLIQPITKSLPFRSGQWKNFSKENPNGSVLSTDDYGLIHKALSVAPERGKEIIIIDDSNYLMTSSSIKRSDETGFKKFVEFAKNHWELIVHAQQLPPHVRTYFMSHIQVDNEGRQRPKSIGKMLDDQVVIEGLFTIVLGCHVREGKHYFSTKNNGNDCIKAPMGMFEGETTDNDLALVDSTITEYYGVKNDKEQAA
jgi:hypothetical protein